MDITSAIKNLMSKGYFVDDREVSERPILRHIVYRQN